MTTQNDLAVATIVGPQTREWIAFYVKKNRDYQAHGQEFGVKGEVHNLGKKIQKIKRALWDEEELIGEQPEEILLDIVGHAMQALYLLRDQQYTEAIDYEMYGPGGMAINLECLPSQVPWPWGGSETPYLSVPHG